MNETHHPTPPDLEDSRLSALYQKSRLEEPAMRLDSVILTRARHAVEKKTLLWFKEHWLVPLSSFALAMLTVSLFIQMKQERPDVIAPATRAPSIQAKEHLKDDVQMKEYPASEVRRKSREGRTTAAPARASVPEMKQESAGKAIAPAAEGIRTQQRGQRQRTNREDVQPGNIQGFTEAPENAPLSSGVTNKASATEKPGVWIERIRLLIKQQKKEEAIRELNMFRQTFPAYKLPDDLQQFMH